MLIQMTTMLGDGESRGERKKKRKRERKEGTYKLVNLS